MRVSDLQSIQIKIASPEDILSWSHGEVVKAETINYRTQKSEKDGLFCERIFGPEKDYECYCGKYKRIRYKGIICDRCGVEVTKSSVRRERMAHIKLACPVSHIWFLRGVPSRVGMVLDIPTQKLEKVIYFVNYIITKVSEEDKKKVLVEIEKEYKMKVGSKGLKAKDKEELKTAKDRVRDEVLSLKRLKIISELEYNDLGLKYSEVFEAGTGAETLKKIFEESSLKELIKELEKDIDSSSNVKNSETYGKKKKNIRRLKFLQGMLSAGIKPEWMFLEALPVLPPDLRPMVQLDGGRYASSDLNDLYRRVINRNNRLKHLLEINAPEVIVRNEKRMLQEAVDALIDNGMRKGQTTKATTGGRRLLKSLADMLKGKQGRFRQNLLGKRVDYSGRSVIVVGPELNLSQCGLPKKMALELFKPFVIKQLLDKELVYNVRGASKLIETEGSEVWEALEEVVKNKLVLLNRAPTLHRLGIQAFYPLLIEGEAIRIHPMVCNAFNADFDGDQMAVHLPLSVEAQREAREIMLSSDNLLKPSTGMPVVSPTQDIILGCYYLTRAREGVKREVKIFSDSNDAKLAYKFGKVDIKAKVKVRIEKELVETTVGRIIFNEALPKDYAFQNYTINSKKLDGIIRKIVAVCENKIAVETLDKIKVLGFEWATISGITWGMDDLIVPLEKKKIIASAEKEVEIINGHFKRGLLSKEEMTNQIIEIWHRAKSEIEKLVPKALPPYGPVFSIVDSGARGSWTQPVQMSGMKGLVINPSGQTMELPVKNSFKEGFDVLEYFISTHGARKGTADTALRTATAGYLTRRLIDVSHEIIVSEEDCGDEEGIEILQSEAENISQNLFFKIGGRIVLEDIRDPKTKKRIVKKGEIIGWEKVEAIEKAGVKKIRVRSPLSCKSVRGICQKCYGWDLSNNHLVRKGEAVGIMAAQAIGEPGTQLTLRTFHTGGVAGEGDITFGLLRVDEVFEARSPAGRAVVSELAGKVVGITSDGKIKVKSKEKKKGKEDIVEYNIPGKKAIWVEKDQEIILGQQLCEGSIELKELFKLTGFEQTWQYVLKEIQNIYVSQGVSIHDKHVEIIIRQMFSRVEIKETGDSSFSLGEVIERRVLLEENKRLKKEKKKTAKGVQIMLGISKVALTTDSFLSAASFQETSRVLIGAAMKGKQDNLCGLKENVIIGKLIPAGTGFKK